MENLEQIIVELQQRLTDLTTAVGTQFNQLSSSVEGQRQVIERHESSITAHQQAIAPKETEYTDELQPANFVPDYNVIKNLPSFNGDRDAYAAWRKQATNTMKIYEAHKDNGQYFNALNILMNAKITGLTLNELTGTNTPRNFKAIIKRFDHAFAEKRSIELLRQQLQFIVQGSKNAMEFYDTIEKHLNLIIGKIQIEFDGKPEVIKTLIDDARKDALKTLLRGLQPAISTKLQMKNPSNLLDAYGKLQEVEFEFEHQRIMNSYAMPRRPVIHPNVQTAEKIHRPAIANQHQQSFIRSHAPYVAPNTYNEQKQSPVERYQQERNNYGSQRYNNAQRSFFARPSQATNNNSSNDDVSMKVLPEKRVGSGQLSFQNKQQRINHIDVEDTEGQFPPESQPNDEHHQLDDEPEEDTISFLG